MQLTHLGHRGAGGEAAGDWKGADSKRERGAGRGWEVLGCKTPKSPAAALVLLTGMWQHCK